MEPGLPAATCALFFDFDGTLVDLAARPDAILVPEDLHTLLARLRTRLGGAVAVVSGRALSNIDHQLGLPGLCVAGVHGAERRAADGRIVRSPVGDLQPALALLEATCRVHPGLQLELKPGAIALHYRQAPQLEDLCLGAMGRALRLSKGMSLLRGKMVLELKPRQANKGLAVAGYLDEPPFRQRRPWYFGDDVTDEAAFELVQGRGGVAVKVGPGDTLAAHRLPDPESVRQWLARACLPATATQLAGTTP